MIVKLIAPGIIPNDYVTVDLQGVPNRGDTVLVESPTGTAADEYTEELLTVVGVCWPVEVGTKRYGRHSAVAALPEVTLSRTPDAGLDDPATITVYNNRFEQIDQYQTPVSMTAINYPKD